jgi:phospholipid/cholesterol/gamma-HCH transport system ATP-binding protein
MIRASGLIKNFGDKEVLKGVDISFEPGRVYGLIGPSGAGKSVLLKTLAGIYPPEAGAISRDHQTMSLMFQEGALFDSMSVFDNTAFPLVDGRVPVANLPRAEKEDVTQRVSYILGRVGLKDAAFKMPSQISGGMRKRAALARALVSKPEVVFLDDPTSGLDPVSSNVIMKLIRDLHAEYHPTMVLVSHDLRRLLPQVDEIVSMFDGRVVFQGDLNRLRQTEPGDLRHFVSCRFDLGSQP